MRCRRPIGSSESLRRVEAHPPRKVIPPSGWLHVTRVDAARAEIRAELTKRARIEERTEERVADLEWPPSEKAPEIVKRYLDKYRAAQWSAPMKAAGRKIAKLALKADEP
jgi:hypothetical protein